jgi:hypothetical protein
MSYTAATERRQYSSERIECPACGAKALAPLVTSKGVDESRGYCFLCRSKVGTDLSKTTAEIPQSTRAQQLAEWYEKTTAPSLRYRNGLSSYLLERYGEDVREHLDAWDIATDGQGNCVFWYRDETGELATAKVVPYSSETAKRRKRDQSPIAWTSNGKQVRVDCLFGLVKGTNKETQEAVVVSFSSSKGFTAPLYGAQFLTEETLDVPVVLVESEKTAVVGSLFLPEFVFVATGGANGLTREKAQALAGRDVLVLLDADSAGKRSEESVVDVLRSVGARPIVELDGKSLAAVLFPEADDGADLADYYLQQSSTAEIPQSTSTAPVVEFTAPAVEFTAPAVEFTAPAVEFTAPAVEFTEVHYEEIPSRKLQNKDYVLSIMLRAYRGEKRLRSEELRRRVAAIVGREQTSDVITRADGHKLFRKHFDWSQFSTTQSCIEFLTLQTGGAK